MASNYETLITALDWQGLRDLWATIEARDTPAWESGKAFEYLILRAFQLSGAQIIWPYRVHIFGEEVEQIDGAVYYAGLSCLVESKDFSHDKVDIAPIAKLRNQLLRRPGNTIGWVFSRTGFTDPARILAQFASPQTILLWNGEEIQYALDSENIADLLLLKYQKCVELALSDYDVRSRSIP